MERLKACCSIKIGSDLSKFYSEPARVPPAGRALVACGCHIAGLHKGWLCELRRFLLTLRCLSQQPRHGRGMHPKQPGGVGPGLAA